jgi:glycosyltransferase involved in cell wall biosynthesis
MSFGLPVIAYDAGALSTTIGKGGVLVRDKDYGVIASLIVEILENEQLRDELIEAGRLRVREASFDRFKSDVEKLFFL